MTVVVGLGHKNKKKEIYMEDIVARYIELKLESKNIEEQLRALETLIFLEHRDDERIKIVAPKKTIVIKERAYELLESIGIETDVVETRKKKIDEFDEDVKKVILSNVENYEEKKTKESIRLKNYE